MTYVVAFQADRRDSTLIERRTVAFGLGKYLFFRFFLQNLTFSQASEALAGVAGRGGRRRAGGQTIPP